MEWLKKLNKRWLLAVTLVLGAAGVFGTLVYAANEDVRNTKHNLAVNPDILAADGTNIKLNQEICVFCHTPHGGRTDVGGQTAGGEGMPFAPLWNRRIRATETGTGNYKPYDGPNFDAAGTTPGVPKGVSLACLSCHDGTIAFDALVNAPGSGGFFKDNQTLTSAGGKIGLTFTGPAVDTTDNSFKDDLRTDTGPSGEGTITGGAAPFPNLTMNLTDDHPISMRIPTTDPQFTDILEHINEVPGASAGTTGARDSGRIFPISRTGAGNLPTDKRDWVRAYPTLNDEPYIECASCHNPHESSPLFLRFPSQPDTEFAAVGASKDKANDDKYFRNTGSLLCLSCHQK